MSVSVHVSVAGQEAATPEHFENVDCERRNCRHLTSPHSGCYNLVNPPPPPRANFSASFSFYFARFYSQ